MCHLIAKLFFCLVMCFSTYAIANQPTDCCVREVVDNKIYLKPTTVYLADDGIFLNIGGSLYPVSHLDRDSKGVYVDLMREDIADVFVGECPSCGDITLLRFCMNSTCKSKKTH